MPVLAMGLAAFLKMIKSRGEEFEGVQSEWLLFIEGFWPHDVLSTHSLSPGGVWKGILATDILPGLRPIVTVSDMRRMLHNQSGSGSVSEK